MPMALRNVRFRGNSGHGADIELSCSVPNRELAEKDLRYHRKALRLRDAAVVFLCKTHPLPQIYEPDTS